MTVASARRSVEFGCLLRSAKAIGGRVSSSVLLSCDGCENESITE